jgi:integrase
MRATPRGTTNQEAAMNKRKPNRRSSIYAGSDGRWHGRVTMGVKPDGGTDRRHVTGKTETEVTRKVQQLERQREAGRTADAGRSPTLEQWLRHWLDSIAARRVRASTLDGYRSKIDYRIVPGIGRHRLARLEREPEHIEAFYVALEREGLSSATVLQIHRILSRALKVAAQRGKIARNPCELVDAPSVRREEVRPLTEDDARAILCAAQTERNAARWSVALALGTRQGEALGLSWDYVNLDEGTVRIAWALQRHRGRGLLLVPPKSRAGRRTIALPAQLVEALRTHHTAQIEERLRASSVWRGSGLVYPDNGAPVELVFAQPNGRPIDPRRDWADWKALLRRAGVRDARLHDARHTAATLLLTQGVDVRVAMAILGHSSSQLTRDTYQHVVPELARDAVELVGSTLWRTEPKTETKQG